MNRMEGYLQGCCDLDDPAERTRTRLRAALELGFLTQAEFEHLETEGLAAGESSPLARIAEMNRDSFAAYKGDSFAAYKAVRERVSAIFRPQVERIVAERESLSRAAKRDLGLHAECGAAAT